MGTQILPSNAYPLDALRSFLNFAPLTFSNLDWISVQERLEGQCCFVRSEENQIKALISCEPENEQAAWLRIFVSLSDGRHAEYFERLLDRALLELREAGVTALYTLSFKPWHQNLFSSCAFLPFTRITTLILSDLSAESAEPLPGAEIRVMTAEDLPALEEVDHSAFSPAWQLNTRSLEAAFRTCTYNTVSLQGGKIVAYQMTAANFYTSHLARLAVHPLAQQQGLGIRLALDTIRETASRGGTEMTVNTQTNNQQSLRLYHRLGFIQQGKLIPVLQKPIRDV